MVTGYRRANEGDYPRVTTDRLTICGEGFVGPGVRINYCSCIPVANIGRPVPTDATAYWFPRVSGDFSYEMWVRPKAAGIAYGAGIPWEPVFGARQYRALNDDGSGPAWFGAANNALQQIAAVCFRGGAGIQAYFNSAWDGEFTITQPFPENMEQWFHLVLNVRLANNSEFFINSTSVGTVAAFPTVNWVNGGFFWAGGMGWAAVLDYNIPIVGAFAMHNRIMTVAEVQASYESGTVNVLDPASSPSTTIIAVDFKDVLFPRTITYDVRGTSYGDINNADYGADRFLGDAPLVAGLSTSTVTFRSDGVLVPAALLTWVLPNRSPGIVPAGVIESLWNDGNYGHRFGYFDGR